MAYNTVSYSNPQQEDIDYYTQTYSGDVSYTFAKTFIVSTNFNYLINTGLGEGFNQSIPLWNASFSKQLFKKKNGELKFSVNDILNQNQSIVRSTSDNYFQDTRSIVLKGTLWSALCSTCKEWAEEPIIMLFRECQGRCKEKCGM